jgi:hypothetical protein
VTGRAAKKHEKTWKNVKKIVFFARFLAVLAQEKPVSSHCNRTVAMRAGPGSVAHRRIPCACERQFVYQKQFGSRDHGRNRRQGKPSRWFHVKQNKN